MTTTRNSKELTIPPDGPAPSTQRSVGLRTLLVCVWSVPPGLVLVIVGWLMAGFMPPPPAHDTAAEIASFYRDDTTVIRLGLLLMLTGFAVWAPLFGVITRQMLHARRSHPVLAYIQLGSGAATWIFLLVPFLVLSAAAFRPERSPEITQALHDTGWIMLFMPFTPFVVQSVAIAVATLLDAPQRPFFPRWVAYFNIMEAISFLPVGLLTFFKTGPFAYHGVLVFWIPILVFFAWMLVMTLVCHRSVLDTALTTVPREPAHAG
ncbi:hypothetical protein Ga0074812_13118 [Parafrankia irregularis]|uniref:Uncharacterized protein n=1 Tax=Parafrankia irregularis TaxID=795642 RepID=A0A0S4QY85_9ACTN|nr:MULTISPECIES: hypothetical protein [Parafrankia]MBE3200314.1 hypothetical protein [Parafrankia sp. CH37]CUU59720.1 hypothetical protein Ga0074812_13118 [Parafrankia irregularis]